MTATLNELRQQAQRYLDAHQFDHAATALEALLERAPGDDNLRLILARVLLGLGQFRSASRIVLDLPAPSPGAPIRPGRLAERAHMLLESGESRAAHEYLTTCDAVNVDSSDAAGLVALAHVNQMIGDPHRALPIMERALQVGADDHRAHYLYGLLLQFVGKLDAAEERFDYCLKRWPGHSSSALARSRLKRQTAESNHLDQLRDLVVKVRQETYAHAEFEYALFKELDDLGRYDDAWTSLAHANAIMAKRNPYPADTHARLVDTIIESSPRQRLGPHGINGPIPIFIVGMPRSGTTLLDRMLSSHSRVTSGGELRDFAVQIDWMFNRAGRDAAARLHNIAMSASLDHAALGRRYLQQTQWRAGAAAFYIDKAPGNVRLVNLMRRALPHAPILHIKRSPMATCFSNLKGMFGDNSNYSYDMPAMAEYYKQYARLCDHWQREWPDTMLEIRFDELVQEPQTAIRRVLNHCGLAYEQACVHPENNRSPVDSLSSAQVRNPIHTRSLEEWRHYEQYLQPLQQTLTG